MTKSKFEVVTPYEAPQCGVLIIQSEQILCGSSEIEDFERVGDDWI